MVVAMGCGRVSRHPIEARYRAASIKGHLPSGARDRMKRELARHPAQGCDGFWVSIYMFHSIRCDSTVDLMDIYRLTCTIREQVFDYCSVCKVTTAMVLACLRFATATY